MSDLFHVLLFLAGALVAGLILHRVTFFFLTRWRQSSRSNFNWSTLRHLQQPLFYLIILFILEGFLPLLPLSEKNEALIDHGFILALIANFGWLVACLFDMARELMLGRISSEAQMTVQARRLRTQMLLIHRVLFTVLVILVLAAMLMTFPAVQSIGAGLFASAGIAGIIVGTAANGVLKNLLAGLQIAFTEPIRLDDVVIVQGEWGVIEEIGAAFVVVKIWDLRRLVVPLNYFIEQPFQNWTRQSSELLGTTFLYLDYSVPFEPLREEFKRILESTTQWDRKTMAFQVTDANAVTMEIRLLMSAPDAPQLFDLRCIVREKMLHFVWENYPEALPRSRSTPVNLHLQPTPTDRK